MLEWVNIDVMTFTDPLRGEPVGMKLLLPASGGKATRNIKTVGKDIDLISFEEYADYESIVKIANENSGVLSEKNFDLTKIEILRIP